MGLLISYLFTLVFWGLIHNIHKKEKFYHWYEWIWYCVGRWWRKKKISWHLIRSRYSRANQNNLKCMNLSCVLGILGIKTVNKQWSYSQWGEVYMHLMKISSTRLSFNCWVLYFWWQQGSGPRWAGELARRTISVLGPQAQAGFRIPPFLRWLYGLIFSL